ncbi:MAG: metallophosphoesterase [Bacteroidales bacterium]|nr:metallophosphoesterase [Bacteroidales bacterium]
MDRDTLNRHFAIGDIHGCETTFKKLLKKIDLQPSDNLYILGDMIDRGNSSAGVLNKIIKLREKGYNIFPIRGNHEQMVIDILESDPYKIHAYLRYFHSEDLLGFKGNIRKRYREFLSSLPYYYELENFILVHASLDLSSGNIFNDINIMLYPKYHIGNTMNLKGKTLIHGHMVQDLKLIMKNINEKSRIIGIDNGCVLGNTRKGVGNLLCLNLDTMELIIQKFSD